MKADSSTPDANILDHDASPTNYELSPHNRLNPDTDVMLRVECMSSFHLKAGLWLVGCCKGCFKATNPSIHLFLLFG